MIWVQPQSVSDRATALSLSHGDRLSASASAHCRAAGSAAAITQAWTAPRWRRGEQTMYPAYLYDNHHHRVIIIINVRNLNVVAPT